MSARLFRIFAVIVLGFSSIVKLSGQETGLVRSTEKSLMYFVWENLVIVMGVIVLIGTLAFIYKLSMLLLEVEHMKLLEEKGLDPSVLNYKEKEGFSFQKLMDFATSMVPVAKESTIDMGHDYDGIRELDNKLPPWWLGIMYGSMLFSVVYMYYYHWSGNEWSSEQEYLEEMEAGARLKANYLFEMANAVNENNVVPLLDEDNLAEGLELYMRNCVACHGPQGQGGVGPNLTDDYWVHGGDIKDIFRTIKYGVPEKGMIAWQTQLRPQNMQQLASYLLTLVGTNPPNPKDPEGELFIRESGD